MSLPARLLGANPSIQVSSLLSGTLTTPSAKQAFIPPTNFESIASFNLASTTASVTFSSIPQTYKDLHIRASSRETGAGTGVSTSLMLRFNGDSNANYARFHIYANGSVVSNANSVTDTKVHLGDGVVQGGSTAGIFGGHIIDISDYTSTTIKKSVRTLAGADNTSSRISGIHSNVWNSTSAITSIEVFPESNSFATGTIISLYGILGA